MLIPSVTGDWGQPIAVVGAGDLVSHLHRHSDELHPAIYRYSIFRFSREFEVTHGLRACDLRDIVKLCQVLAFTMVDDGWLRSNEREVVIELVDALDELTRRWSETNHG